MMNDNEWMCDELRHWPWCWLLRSQAQRWCGLHSRSPWRWSCPLCWWCPRSELPSPCSNAGPSGCLQSPLVNGMAGIIQRRKTFEQLVILHFWRSFPPRWTLDLQGRGAAILNFSRSLASSPDWLMKKQTSSLNTGVFLSRKSLASSTMTGSSVSSSSTWRVWKRNNNAAWHRFLIKRVEWAESRRWKPHTCVHSTAQSFTISRLGSVWADMFPEERRKKKKRKGCGYSPPPQRGSWCRRQWG